jgi:AcrR family transcriptional regulator
LVSLCGTFHAYKRRCVSAAEGCNIFYRSVQKWVIVGNMKAVGVKNRQAKATVACAHMGRPRCFDASEALDAALQVFWKKGYEGASLSDLTAAMHIERPSLYATFGNKEELFLKVLDRYADTVGAFVAEALNEPTGRAVVERLLMKTADALTNPCNQPGCMTVQGALSGGDDSKRIRRELDLRRDRAEAVLRKRLERAKSEGDLPAGANAADLARYVLTVSQGMAVQAKGGATRAQLRRVAQTTLAAWPR